MPRIADDRSDAGVFSGFVIFQGFAGRKSFPPFLRRVGREPCGTTFGNAPSVIADFQREASSRPRQRQNISRFCDISGVCRQENIASVLLSRIRREPRRPKFGRAAFGRAGSDFSAKPLSRSSSGFGLGPALHRRPAPGIRGPFGIAAWNGRDRGTTRPPTAMGQRGPGPNEKSRGVRSRMRLRLQRNDHAR